jgi:hypothetical protein
MPLYKFGVGDVFYNQIKAHPSSSFYIYDSSVYLNNKATEPGSFVSNVGGIPTGHVSLFELNVDRAANSDETLVIGHSSSGDASLDPLRNVPDTGLVYPFVYRGLQKMAFKSMTRSQFNAYTDGDVLTGSYQMSASIVRSFYNISPNSFFSSNKTGSALRNSVDYAARLGPHYITSSWGETTGVNVIDIPSTFFGSGIKRGSVKLDFYVTGTLMGSLRDKHHNGALIQESGSESSAEDGQIAGVVLYEEGFIILTGSWNMATALPDTNVLNDVDFEGSSLTSVGNWLRYGMGANDLVTPALESLSNGSASYGLSFAGTHKIPTVTMLAHANRGELNYSNNPTYIEYSVNTASYYPTTGSYFYGEQELTIKNIHSSSYSDPTGSLKKTTYITKVGIYDDKKKLIGIASVAKPVKKTEERDLTFKLKLDI